MKKKLSLLMLLLVCLIGGSIAANAIRKAAGQTVTWEFSTWDNGDITETKTVDGLTVAATSSKKVSIDGSNKTFGDVSYTKRLKLGGSGAADSRNLSFEVTGPCTISVDFAHANGSGDPRTMKLDAGAFGTNVATQDVDGGAQATLTYKYDGTAAQTFYLYSASSGLNIYGITVKYDDTTDPDEPDTPEEPVVGGTKTIVFKDAGAGTTSDSGTKRTAIDDIIAEGAEYVSAIPTANDVYQAREGRGVKLGTGKRIGELTLTLAETVKPSKITFKARQYNAKGEQKIIVNGQAFAELTSDFVEYEIPYDGNTEVSQITINTDGESLTGTDGTSAAYRAYITELSIVTEGSEQPVVTLPGTPVWQSDAAVAADWSSDAIKADASKLADATVGDIIHVAVEGVTPGEAWNAQVAIKDGAWTDLEAGLPVGDGTVTDAQFVITGDILKYIQANGLQISGNNYSTRLVTIEKTETTGSEASIWVGQTAGSVTVNLNHFKNANDKGGIKAGQIIRVTATAAATEGDKWLILSYSGSDTNWSWVNYEGMDAQAADAGFDFVVTEEALTHMLADGIIVNQSGYNISQIEIVDAEPAAPEAQDITISPVSGDITAALAAAEEGVALVGNITINLTEGATYTASGTIVANNGLVVNGNGATIDASALSAPLFAMNAEPVIDAVESGQFVVTAPITIDGVTVKNLTNSLFADNGKGYAYENLTINNSVVEYAAQSNFVLNLASSMAINLNITNSTFYSIAAGSANFIAMSGKRPWQITGYEEETGKFTCANNTFYNVAKSKQFLNTNTLKGQRYLYAFNSNIFVNVSNKKIYGNMTNNKNQLTTDGKNTYLMDGEFFAETNYNGDEGLQTDPSFADADNGNFTIFAGSEQAQYQTGDPRWLVDYNESLIPAKDITISPADGDIYAALATAEEGVKKVGNITINLTEGATYTASGTIVANNGLVVNGNGATIDASALSVPLFAMNAEPVIEAVESGQFVVTAPITIDGVTVKGLTKAFFADNGKGYAYENLTINNSVVEYTSQGNVVLNLASSMAINLNITNSTFYSIAAGSANFIAMSGKRPWQITGYEEETGKFTCANNTFYNVAKSKQFLNTNTLKGQRYLYVFNSNIFVNVSNKKIYGNMTNNKNQLTTDGKNTYLMDGEFFAETNYNGDEGLQTDPSFADADNGDFTIAVYSDQAKNQTGDPRWLVAYEEVIPQQGEIWIAGEQGFEDKEQVAQDELFPNYQITFSAGGNNSLAPTYWANDKAVRVYTDNTFTVSGKNVAKVTIHYVKNLTGIHDGVITANTGEMVNDQDALTWTWTGLANQVTFTVTDINTLFIEAIEVEYLSPKSVVEGLNALAEEIQKAEELLGDETNALRRDDLAAAIEEAKKHLNSENTYDIQDAIKALQDAEEDFIDANTPKDVVLDLASGKDIATELAAATAERLLSSITINLAPEGKYTISAPLEAPVSIVINGDAEAPATIDASANEGDALILLSTAPQVDAISSYYRLSDVTIANVEIKGIKKSIVYDNNTKYCVETLTIDNAVLALETEAVSYESLIAFQQGGVKDLIVKNSTIYGNNAVAKYFVRYNNSARLDRYGYDKNTEYQTMTYVNNTFYNLLVEDGQWGNYSGYAGQNYSAFVIEGNIWYNCGKDIIRRLIGGRYGSDAPRSFNFNTYFNGGEDNSASEASYDESGNILTTDPQFADAANADFTLYAGSQQAQYQTGDPRWWVEYDPALGISNATANVKTFDGNWYNLQGVRVERPTKGIYIHNGKKVVIK